MLLAARGGDGLGRLPLSAIVFPVNRSVVALLTDFGAEDVYVGVMKAVILSQAPAAHLLDLTHQVAPGDVARAAFRLWQAAPHLPNGTVILAVVDPGVGTSRRAIALELDGLRCVGPDNGIFTYLLATRRLTALVELTPPPPGTSSTFHGRDLFAPAAARLCSGFPLERLGARAVDPVLLALPTLSVDRARIGGEIIAIDRFGNAVTSIGVIRAAPDGIALTPWLPTCAEALLSGSAFQARLSSGAGVRLARTFGDVPKGGALAYVGSDGLMEIAVNGGSAADVLRLAVGDPVQLQAL